jgi:N-acetylglucosamine kinase-like BadF-type ATPase
MALFCGCEGGGTNTVCVVMDANCKVLGRAAGGGSNHYLTGLPAVCALLGELAAAALADAGMPRPSAAAADAAAGASTTPVFTALGVCASGFLEAGPQRALEGLLRAAHPWLSASYYIDNDSPGSIYTAAGASGGCVLIAGTGSMGQLLSADGTTINCGGNGHMYGDGACG